MTVVPARNNPSPAGLARWDNEQLEILKTDLGIKTDAHLAYFAQVCAHKDLDPFMDEIVPIYYGDEMVIQETVQGLRTIAERSGLYGGYQGPWYTDGTFEPPREGTSEREFVWVKGVWLDEERPPVGAKFLVFRKDWSEPAEGFARWSSCVQLNRYGKPRDLWKTRPDEMLAKTAEVRALRRAFSKEFARAGVNVRTLTDAQVIAAEGRRIGLSDEERHALAAEVSGGRTDSSTELTDDERLAARAEIARRRPVEKVAAGPGGTQRYWVDPDTGEFVDPPDDEESGGVGEVRQDTADHPASGSEPQTTQPPTGQAPTPDGPDGYVDTDGRIRVPDNLTDDEKTEWRQLAGELVPRARALQGEARRLFQAWLDGAQIGSAKKVKDYTLDELRRTAEAITEFEKPIDEEPL